MKFNFHMLNYPILDQMFTIPIISKTFITSSPFKSAAVNC